jgi:NADH dehydrogenase
MKVQKIKLSSYDVTWIILDDNHLPIKPILEGKTLPAFKYRLGCIVALGKYDAFGSLGKYGISPRGFIQGKTVQFTYDSFYRSHQKRLHGIFKDDLLWLSEQINKNYSSTSQVRLI